MMSDTKTNTDKLINTMIYQALEDLTKENENYRDYRKNREVADAEFDDIIRKMENDDQKLIEEWKINIFKVWSLELKHCYRRGCMDCIKFLKVMKLI